MNLSWILLIVIFSDIINGLARFNFQFEKIHEPKGYTLEEIKQMNPEDIPYHGIGKDGITPWIEKFIQINKIIPFSLIISVHK